MLAREAAWQSYPPEKPPRNSSSSSANDVTERSPLPAQVPQQPARLSREVVGKDDSAEDTESGWEALREEWAAWEQLPSLCLELQDASAIEAKDILAKRQLWPDLLKPDCIWLEHSPLMPVPGLLPAPSCAVHQETQIIVYVLPDTMMLGSVSSAHCCALYMQHQLWV